MKKHNDALIKRAYARGYSAGKRKAAKDDVQGGTPVLSEDDLFVVVYGLSIAIGASKEDGIREKLTDAMKKVIGVKA